MGTYQVQDEDLHAAAQVEQENDLVADMLKGYDNDEIPTIDPGEFLEPKAAIETEIWLGEGTQGDNILDDVDVNGAASSIFYNEDFPVLPDFPCMSSSSSSSSIPAPCKAPVSPTASCSSSSAASRALMRSDQSQDGPAGGTVECMDGVENLEYMDLIDVSDLWDPSSIFEEEENMSQVQNRQVVQEEHRGAGKHCDELGMMFFEWLKNNRNHITAEEMRSIKLKRSTVESALKRLGTTMEGKKQLLKLILQWVEQYQLQKKRNPNPVSQFPSQYVDPLQNPNPNPNLAANSILINPNTPFHPPTWIPTPVQPYTADPGALLAPGSVPTPVQVPPGFYVTNSYPDVANFKPTPTCQYPPLPQRVEYQMIDGQTWQNSKYVIGSQYTYAENINMNVVPDTMNPQSAGFYGDQYRYPCHQVVGENGERSVRLGSLSATKEARKKRMARQRKSFFHHHHHSRHQHHTSNNHQNQVVADQNLRLGAEHCAINGQSNAGAWVYVPCGSGAAPGVSTVRMIPPAIAPPAAPPPEAQKRTNVQNYQRQAAADRRQGWKQEKNLKFLLQKVLKQSDVGNLGRIVLPKKEAETHLPPLETRDGISITIEDIGTSRLWNMRYRFWPNNKSRMYLLENTGEFVRANGLQEGDFIVIYSDMRCGKYLIRGVKVRPAGPKPEGKKTGKRNQRTSAAANCEPQSSPAAGKPKEEE